jgi:hypothetical protein
LLYSTFSVFNPKTEVGLKNAKIAGKETGSDGSGSNFEEAGIFQDLLDERDVILASTLGFGDQKHRRSGN